MFLANKNEHSGSPQEHSNVSMILHRSKLQKSKLSKNSKFGTVYGRYLLHVYHTALNVNFKRKTTYIRKETWKLCAE